MKNNPIPSDQARWSVYGKLYQDNQQFLWGILDQLAKQKAGRNATQQKIGDLFGSCMDEAAVNKLGAKPLQPYLDQIAAMKSTKICRRCWAIFICRCKPVDCCSTLARIRILETAGRDRVCVGWRTEPA